MSVEVKRDAHGRAYEATARWRDPEGKQRKKTFKGARCQTLAREHEAAMRAEVKSGDYVPPSKMTVHELAVEYVANRPYRGESRRRNEGRLRALAQTPLGKMRVQRVRPSHVQSWATKRAGELGPSTMKVELSWIRSVFRAGVDDEVIKKSPVPRKVALPTGRGGEKLLPYDVEEVRAIAAKLPPRLRVLPVLQAGVGVRIGEALALRAQVDVDFLGRVVRVREQLHPKKRTREPVKTESSVRDVPLSASTAQALAAHIAEFGTGPDGELFTMDDGRTLWQYGRVRDWMKGALEAAGARGNAGGPTHAFRHSYASILLAAGESVVAVAERLGHADGGLVLSTYGHLMADSENRTRKAVDDAWSAKSASDVPSAAGTTP